MGPLERADIDVIEGLSPTIAVRQQPFQDSIRSTVGTLTEIYDYLRVLFTHIGRPHCWQCGKPIWVHTVQQIVDELLALPGGTRIHVLAPMVAAAAGDRLRQLEELLRNGFVRVEIDGEVFELPDALTLPLESWSRLELVVDRLAIRDGVAKRLADSVEVALKHGQEKVRIGFQQEVESTSRVFTRSLACVDCGIPFPEVTPRFFSFNNPEGACARCKGLGVQVPSGKGRQQAVAKICSTCAGSRLRKESQHVTIGGLSIVASTRIHVLAPMVAAAAGDRLRQLEELLRNGFVRVEIDGEVFELPDALTLPLESWSRLELVVDRLAIRDGVAKRLADSVEVALKHGQEKVRIGFQQEVESTSRVFTRSLACVDCGIPFPEVTPRFFSFNNPEGACARCKGLGVQVPSGKGRQQAVPKICSTCAGSRLRKESQHVTIGGLSIVALTALPVTQARQALGALELAGDEATVAQQLLEELRDRLHALERMDLGYISLDRRE